jgi:hypothetical protein
MYTEKLETGKTGKTEKIEKLEKVESGKIGKNRKKSQIGKKQEKFYAFKKHTAQIDSPCFT